jgi:hypothetical protein
MFQQPAHRKNIPDVWNALKADLLISQQASRQGRQRGVLGAAHFDLTN